MTSITRWSSGKGRAEKIAPPDIHPCVYMTPDDIARARTRVDTYAWARAERDSIVKAAAEWVARSDEWYRENTPASGACFAYGFTGCPICGAGWGVWWGVQAAWATPGKVACANGHVLPDAVHPDSGTGYVAPDGRIHYFVGSYNAWVIENLTFRAVNLMTYAYVLTEEEEYAAKAAYVLDLIAAIYPSCTKGSWDYPLDPPSGRLDRPLYQVSRVLVHYADQYDLLYNSSGLEAPSVVSGLTRRQNIEQNLLRNGAAYCHENAAKDNAMNNGCADYLRGAMAVGICLGIPEYVSPAAEGPTGILAMLDNNLDRDGAYYETSTLYAHHTRSLYTTFAEPLYNLRSAAYPNGVDLYRNPRYRALNLLNDLSQNCLGVTPRYGDSGLNVASSGESISTVGVDDYFCIERLYARTGDPKAKVELARLLWYLARGDIEGMRARAESMDAIVGGGVAERCWLLFHAEDAPTLSDPAMDMALSPEQRRRIKGSHFLGQKGIGVLRSQTHKGSATAPQAALVRFGPSLNHGHLDDLNLNYFALGRELTYDLGYHLGSTHTQVGWSKQTASHNLVLVDEKSQGEGPGRTGGSLHLFSGDVDGGAPQVLEASSEDSYAGQGVSVYRRTVILLDGCLVDIFRVRGGSQHDYLLHARSHEADFEGIAFDAQRPGSLAGPEYDWGDRQLNDGDMDGHPNKPYWNPPPGNGLGFLTHVQSAGIANTPFSVNWRIDDNSYLRAFFAAGSGTEVLTAIAPGILPSEPKARYMIARRKRSVGTHDHQSCFVMVAEPHTGLQGVDSIEIPPLAPAGPPAAACNLSNAADEAIEPVAVQIHRADNGGCDIVYSSGDSVARKMGNRIVAARFAHAAYAADGALLRLSLVGGNHWEGDGWKIEADQAGWSGAVSEIDYDGGILTLSLALPSKGELIGKTVYFRSLNGGRTAAYRIVSVEPDALSGGSRLRVDGDLLLGRGEIGEVRSDTVLTSNITHEYALSIRRPNDSGFFDGKQMCGVKSGATARIRHVQHGSPMVLTVDCTSGFQAGERFHYREVAQGDTFVIHGTISFARESDPAIGEPSEYRLTSDLSARAIRLC